MILAYTPTVAALAPLLFLTTAAIVGWVVLEISKK